MSLEDRFHLKEVNHQELLLVLLSFFGECMGTEKGYRYPENEKVFLDVQLDNKSGKVIQVNPSKEFPCEEIDKIETRIKEGLIDNQIHQIYESVGFSGERVEGYFRYKFQDKEFQVIPVPDTAPKPKVLMADHPFLLQFSYIFSPDPYVNSARRQQKLSIYIRLLNLLSNSGITLGHMRSFWAICDKDRRNLTSEWKESGYICERFPRKSDEYTPVDNFLPIRRVSYKDYYSYSRSWPSAISSGHLEFPDNLEESFDQAFGLSSEDWQRFFMACSWYYQSTNIQQESFSSAFMALINAIECLIDKPEKEERCSCCGQLKYSVAKRFNEFLKKHVPFLETAFPEEEKLIYKVRSKLTHGHDLLIQDLEPWAFILNTKADRQEDILQRKLCFITRTAIYSWLWSRGKSLV